MLTKRVLQSVLVSVALSAVLAPTALAERRLVADLAEIDFGVVAERATVARTVTITNPDPDPVKVWGYGLDAKPHFSLPSSTCMIATELGQGDSCTVGVAFTAPEGGSGSYESSLTVNGDLGATPAVTLLYGSVKPRAQVAATPSALDFGPTPVGGASRPRAITIRNTGSLPATLTAAPVVGPFRIERNSCLRTLAPGAICQLAVAFAPVPDGLDAPTEDPVRFGRIRLRTPDRIDLSTIPLSGVVEPPEETARRIQRELDRLARGVPRLVRGGPRGGLRLPSFYADVRGDLMLKLYTRRHGRLRLLGRRTATLAAGEKRRLRFVLTKTGRRVLRQQRRPTRTVTFATFHAAATGTAVSASRVVVIRPRAR